MLSTKSLSSDLESSFDKNESNYVNSDNMTYYRKVSIINPSNLMFSGRGSVSRDNCGDHYGFFSCKGAHKITHRRCYCYQMSCPICFHKAITRNSNRITYRFKKIYRAYRRLGHRPRFKHYSFNTLWDIRDNDDFDYYRSKLTRILNQLDMNGLLIFHPYRKQKITKKQFLEGIKPKLHYSPHFHFIGFCSGSEGSKLLPSYDDFRAKYHFTYSNITEKRHLSDPVKYPKYLHQKELYLCARYLLSHCGFKTESKAHSYFWVGSLSPRRVMRINEVKETIPILCPLCEQEFDDGHIYKLDNPEYSKTDLQDNWSRYTLKLPFYFDYSIYLVKRVHKYDLHFRQKKIRVKDKSSGRYSYVNSGVSWGPCDRLKGLRNFNFG